MNLVLDRSLASGYTSGLQIARRVTENWMEQNMFCPICGHCKVRRFENNTPVGDFYCEQCNDPLGPHTRRAGWIGCRISIGAIPDSGKIHIVQDGRPTPVRKVVSQYQRTLALNTGRVKTRGWLFDVLRCIERISSDIFTINDIYGFTNFLKRQYPDNQFVRPKIRQQLQRLRDRGFITFLGNGVYKKVLPLIKEPIA